MKFPPSPALRTRLDALLERISIRSSQSFSLDQGPAIQVESLVQGLEELLYDCGCTAPAAGSPADERLDVPRSTQRDSAETKTFLQRLSQANHSQERWDQGWRIESIDPYNDRFSVTKGDRQRVVPLAGEFRRPVDDQPPQVGDEVHLRAGREIVHEPAGFYTATGERLGDGLEDALAVHFYFHLGATHAADGVATELLTNVTETLNRALIPFRFTCRTDPGLYDRTDAAILCVSRRFFSTTADLLRQHLPERVRHSLAPEVPLFTQALLPGIGFAESWHEAEKEAHSDRFLQHRCRLVAEGLVDAWNEGRQDLEARWQAIDLRFQAAGLRLDRPHLEAGSAELPQTDELSNEAEKNTSQAASHAPNMYLQAAEHLGQRLCRDAIWHQQRCNWLSWIPQAPTAQGDLPPAYGALGPDLANGGVGVALFLAELWRHTGDPRLRTTAEGAARHALYELDQGSSLDNYELDNCELDNCELNNDVLDASFARGLQRLGEIFDHQPWIEYSQPQEQEQQQEQAESTSAMPWVESAASHLDLHLQGDQPWPCGLPEGKETLGLQFGLAGIGYAFLRRLDPESLPSLHLILPNPS